MAKIKHDRRCVGVILSQPNTSYQQDFIDGVMSEAYRMDTDVLVFSTCLREGGNEKYIQGEVNIYKLINDDMLDGMIIVPDELQYPGVRGELLDHYANSTIPTVLADYADERFTSVFSDDKEDMRQLVSHIVGYHNMRDVAYVTGYKGHVHAMRRAKAFIELMDEYAITVPENRIHYGDFWYDCAPRVVEEILAVGLPQCIMCVSDATALGVVEALREKGIRVPEDVSVTGFDADGDGITKPHYVTSVAKNNNYTGREAFRKLLSCMGAELPPATVRPAGDFYISMTCGCRSHYENYAPAENLYLGNGFNSLYNFMMEEINSADNLVELLWKIDWYTNNVAPFERLGICLNENWNDESDSNMLSVGYTPTMTFAYDKFRDEHSVDLDRKYDLKLIYPPLHEKRDYPTTYFFMPLHFTERCFGFLAISYGKEIVPISLNFNRWLRMINCSLESIRRQMNLRAMYRRVEETSLLDLLTGTYNRNGFNLFAPQMLQKARKGKLRVMVILGDLNCLKYINDTFGHVAGDNALQIVARAVTSFVTQETGSSMFFRIGGDEFVYMSCGDFERGDLDTLIANINGELDRCNREDKLPYPVHFSMGTYFAEPSDDDTADTIITACDAELFVNKREIKEKTGFNHRRD